MSDVRAVPPLTEVRRDDGAREYDGEALAVEMFDLLRRRLPRLAEDDPVRCVVQQLLPALGEALGRPRLLPVAERPASQ